MTRQHQLLTTPPAKDIHQGLVFIPDISGFTKLVHSTDILTGKQITFELLSAVIDQNRLGLSIAEVEGDAVLFYRYGKAPVMNELMQQYELMLRAFEAKRLQLQQRYSQATHLALKVIAHYGAMTEYHIGPFKKLYGEVVVEAHRLLKNNIESDSYLLLTDSLVATTSEADKQSMPDYGAGPKQLCEVYRSSGNLCFTYFDFNEKLPLAQAA